MSLKVFKKILLFYQFVAFRFIVLSQPLIYSHTAVKSSNTASAFCAISSSGASISGTITGCIPAAKAALIPLYESSMTYASPGSQPSSSHARRNISGSGLLLDTISPPTITSKYCARSASSICLTTNAVLVEEAIATL